MATETKRSRDALARSIDQVEAVLAEISSDRLGDPTPCREWTVGELVAHLVADPTNFVTMAKGDEVDWTVTPALPDDWTSAFRSAADDLMQMWNDAGEEASPQSMDWQTAEFAVHTWDLVRALGDSRTLDDELAERGLAFMGAALTPENRGQAFGPAVEVSADAPVYDRLVAVAGRNPG